MYSEVVRLYSVVEIVVMSDKVACCSVVCGTLVGMSVFCIMCSELLVMSEISLPLWSSVCEYQSVEYAFTSPLSIESGMLVKSSMQYAMSVSTVLCNVVTSCLLVESMCLLLCCLWSCLCVF